MVVDVLRRHAMVLGGVCLALLAAIAWTSTWTSARAGSKDVKLMMDWIIQGTHAPFFIAQKNGYFAKEGVTVDTIDAGKGATNVAVKRVEWRLSIRLGRSAVDDPLQRDESVVATD